MKGINILFLGASKRTTLLEQFIEAAKILSIDIKLFSCEISDDFCPISHLATILKGPSFNDEKFLGWLNETVTQYSINIVIPNMDSATVALAKFKELYNPTCDCVVSDYELCNVMNDKLLAEKFFINHKLQTFENNSHIFPKIVKYKYGFGGHGQYIVNSQIELEHLYREINANEYITQDYIVGQETTVDIYISKNNELKGYVLRDRESVSDGEVMNCTTRDATKNEQFIITSLAKIPGWRGCITLQYITDKNNDIRIVEINPRFGGGATCAIKAGLNMPLYILSEYINKTYIVNKIKHIKMRRSRRDFYCEC